MGPSQKLNIKILQAQVHQMAREKGFWANHGHIDFALKISLIASEAFEALESLRKGSPRSEVASELADIVIRTLDFAEGYGVDLGIAIEEKIEKNKSRPKMHGKLF